ncbi:hypothetical protein DN748_10475 [Sinomicrobium soli]|nr:hypothetical protein DN748_10475 [Sinomicrobium sp. N-1-3-6]
MYLAEFAHLLKLIGEHPVEGLSPQRLRDYFLYCVQKEKMSERKINGKINAVFVSYFQNIYSHSVCLRLHSLLQGNDRIVYL